MDDKEVLSAKLWVYINRNDVIVSALVNTLTIYFTNIIRLANRAMWAKINTLEQRLLGVLLARSSSQFNEVFL